MAELTPRQELDLKHEAEEQALRERQAAERRALFATNRHCRMDDWSTDERRHGWDVWLANAPDDVRAIIDGHLALFGAAYDAGWTGHTAYALTGDAAHV